MIPPRMTPEELELDEVSLQHANTAPTRAEDGFLPPRPPPRRRNGGRVVLVVFLLLLLIGGGVASALWLASLRVSRFLDAAPQSATPTVQRGDKIVYTPTLTPSAATSDVQPGTREETPMLFVDSTPSGAVVLSDGLELGTTPLAVETPYPEGEVFEIEVRTSGRAPWRAKLAGGRSHLLSAQLSRK